MIESMSRYYETTHYNVHRGVYELAQEATRLFEEARAKVASFIGAPSGSWRSCSPKTPPKPSTSSPTRWGRKNLGPSDVVVASDIEHHANLVPWLQLREEKGIELRFFRVGDDGTLQLDDLARVLDGAKLLAVTGASNVLGTLPPVRAMADAAHAAGALVLVDGAQYVAHMPTSVPDLGADFVAFTGHKMLGPTGIGGLWARRELLDAMPPFLTGGEMIRDVRLDGFTTNDVPWKFEAGTPPIAEAIGLGVAVDYLRGLGMAAVRAHEQALTGYAMQALKGRYGDDIVIYGPASAAQRCGIVSFTYRDIHAHDISQVLDEAGVCVRAGHHCAKPLMRQLGVERDGAGVVLGVQRRGGRRRLSGRHRPSRRRLRLTTRAFGGAFLTVMPGLEDLYREIILDHYRNPRNRGELESPPAVRTEGFNPLCGDEVVIYLDADAGVITDLRVSGQGCSISQSSASMMSVAVKGKNLAQARATIRAFRAMMSLHGQQLDGLDDVRGGAAAGSTAGGAAGADRGPDGGDDERSAAEVAAEEGVSLGDLEALQGVVKFPVRIKCATLSWHTLAQALDEVETTQLN